MNKKLMAGVVAGAVILTVACNMEGEKKEYEDVRDNVKQEEMIQPTKSIDEAADFLDDFMDKNWTGGRYKVWGEDGMVFVYLDMDYTLLTEAQADPESWQRLVDSAIEASGNAKIMLETNGFNGVNVGYMIGDMDLDRVYISIQNDKLLYDVMEDIKSNL